MKRPWLEANGNTFPYRKLIHVASLKARIGWQSLRTDEFVDEGPYCVTGTDFRNGKIDWSAAYHVSTERYEMDRNIQLSERDLLVTKDGTIGKVAVVDKLDAPATLNSGVFVVRPKTDDLSTDFLGWVVRSKVFDDFVAFNFSGSTINHLYQNVFETFRFPFPDLATQRRIADFLDRETARIDLLIEKKQRLVALLRERDKVLVEEHLNGLDASHIYRLKFAIRRIEQGWSPQCEDATVDGEKWGILKLGAITTGVYLENQHKALPKTIDPVPSLRVEVSDVLVARASGSPKLVGKAAFVETANLNLMLSDKHFRLVPNPKKVLPEYLAIVVNSGKSRSQIEYRLSSAEGMARNIGQNVIYGLRCPFPPLERQEEILRAVRSSRTNTNAIASKTNASIDRLQEYRSALITAAVTGQTDVRTYTKSGTPDRHLDAIQEEMGA